MNWSLGKGGGLCYVNINTKPQKFNIVIGGTGYTKTL